MLDIDQTWRREKVRNSEKKRRKRKIRVKVCSALIETPICSLDVIRDGKGRVWRCAGARSAGRSCSCDGDFPRGPLRGASCSRRTSGTGAWCCGWAILFSGSERAWALAWEEQLGQVWGRMWRCALGSGHWNGAATVCRLLQEREKERKHRTLISMNDHKTFRRTF